MPDPTRTSTLLVSERALRPAVLAVMAASELLSLAGLAWSLPRAPRALWVACAIVALLPAISNHRYLHTHEMTTFGMMPLSLLSLVPSLACMLATSALSAPARLACTIGELALLSFLVTFVCWFFRLRGAYSTRPAISDDAALIVLGGAIKHGKPCSTLARRLDVTAGLLREKPGRMAVVSGGSTPDGSTTEAREMARYLIACGVPPESVLLEPKARNTRENIALSCGLLDAHGMTRQRCVVSSDYHLWRAKREAQALGITLTPVAAPTPRASIAQQWCREVLTILFGR